MKGKLLTISILLLIVAIISALFFTLSPQQLLSRLSIFGDLYTNASLTITARNSINTVTIDGQLYGDTPIEVLELSEGQHEILLERKVVEESINSYEPVKIYLDLQTNTESIIDLEIGPYGNNSGYALYYTPSPTNKEAVGYLTITSSLDEIEVDIEGRNKLDGAVEILEMPAQEYNITISSKGYESIQLPIIIREGLNLNLNVSLLPIPINLESE